MGIHITKDLLVRFDDLFDFNLDEKVERVNVLLDQAFDLEKSWEQIPFVLHGR